MVFIIRYNPVTENSFRPVAQMVTRLQRKRLRGWRSREVARAYAVTRAPSLAASHRRPRA